LVSYTQIIVATGEKSEIFGKAPRGFVNYGRDGRMMVLIVKDQRPKPTDLAKMTDHERADLFRTLVAYAGTEVPPVFRLPSSSPHAACFAWS
jgi:hypothetical protein